MTLPRNFSFRNSEAAFVQCGGAPSCIHESEERVAEWRSLGQIMLCSNLKYETLLTDDKWPSSSRNAWTIETIPLIMAMKIITLTSFLSFVSQIPLNLSCNVFKPLLKGIARRRSKTFARMSWSVRRCLKVGGHFQNFCKASEDVPYTIWNNKCLILIKIHSLLLKWCIYKGIWRILSSYF